MTKKRASGEGTIRQLKSGRWSWVKMTGRDENGKPTYDRLTADTQRELVKAIETYNHSKAVRFTPAASCHREFSSFADSWFSRHKTTLRVSTQSSYGFTLSKLKDYWADTPLSEIRASGITAMLIHFRENKLSESYVHKLRSMMYQILEAAEADGMIYKNPVRYVKSSPRNNAPGIKDAFTPEELKKLNSHRNGSKLGDLILLSCATGMRPQELLALRGTDISEGGKSIFICKAINMNRNTPEMGLTKNLSSYRTIPVPSAVRHIADKYRAYEDTLIWQSPTVPNRTINPSSYRAAFKRFCTAAGVRPLTPHCCRHTYVTQLHAHGVDMLTIKMLTGHARHDVTEGYTHVAWETLVDASNKLNDLFEDKNVF